MTELEDNHSVPILSPQGSNTEGYYRSILNIIQDGCMTLDNRLNYTFINQTAVKLIGVEASDLLGKYAGTVIPNMISVVPVLELESCFMSQEPRCVTGYNHLLNLWLEVHMYPTVSSLSVLIRDISAIKKAELKLLKTESRFRALIENSSEIISLTDNKGKVFYVNRAFVKITGYSAEEIRNKPNSLITHPDFVDESKAVFEKILAAPGVPFQRLNRLRHKHGYYVWVEGTVTNLLEDKNVGAIVTNYRDITARKEAQESLAASEELYRSLFQNLLHGFAYCQVIYKAGRITDFIYVAVNNAYEASIGLQHIAGKKASDVLPRFSVSDPHLLDSINRVVLSGRPEQFETYMEAFDKWFSITLYSPVRDHFVGLVKDITEKKKSHEQQSLFVSIVNSSDDAIISKDLNGTITSWNKGAEQLFGYEAKEAIGLNVSRLIPPGRQGEEVRLMTRIKSGEHIEHYETQRVKKNGDLISVSLALSPIYDARGIIIGSSKIIRDISGKKLAEEKIKNSESNLLTIIENSTEAFVLMDRDFYIKAFNTKARESLLLQFGEGKIKEGDYFLDFIHKARQAKLRWVLARVLEGELIQYDTDFYSTDNQRNWFYANIIPVMENGHVTGICVAVKDVTKRKESENQIRQSEENMRAIFENTTQGFILLGLDCKIKTFNQNAVKFGYAASARLMEAGKSFFDFVLKSKVAFFKAAFAKVLKGETYYFSRSYEKPGGEFVSFDFSISPVYSGEMITGICITGNDVTDKKQRELEREFNQNNLESLINNTSDLMWSIDRNYRLITSNKPFANLVELMIGTTVSKGINLMLKEFGEESLRRFKQHYDRAFAGETFSEIEYNERPVPTWSEISYYPIYNANVIIGTACFAKDITERVKSAGEKEILIKELAQHNKDLQQFAYITSHNLRSPISSLLGLSSLLEGYSFEDETLKKILAGIKKATLQFDETIRDLSSILSIKDNISVPSELLLFEDSANKALSQCEKLIESSRATVNLDFSLANSVVFNKSYLESIFLNLLTNAIKYRAYNRALVIDIKTERTDGHVILRFTDNGIGLDAELHKHKLFSMYQRFHTDREGKGLGLFLIKSQMEAFGGSINIKSRINEGAEFSLQFKARDGQ